MNENAGHAERWLLTAGLARLLRKLSGKRQLKTIIFLSPIVAFSLFLSVKIVSKSTYNLIVQEDSTIEYIQAAAFFVASIFSLIISIRFLKKKRFLRGILYLILFSALVFISLEEISWGQRIFNIELPTYFEKHNFQKEISIHNLLLVPHVHHTYILLGLFGTFAWMFIPHRTRMKYDHIVRFLVPDWYLSSYFFFVFIIYSYFEYLGRFAVNVLRIHFLNRNVFFMFRDQEPAELLLSLGLLLFVIINSVRQKEYA